MQQDREQQKNLILAIVLSVAVLISWQLFYASPKLKEDQERRQRIQQEQAAQTKEQPPGLPKAIDGVPGAAPKPGALPATGPTPTMTREAALKQSPRVAVSTPSLTGSIALKGGRIDDLVLAKYRETVEKTSPHVVLFSPSGAPEPYYAEYGWTGPAEAGPMPDRDTLWSVEKGNALTPEAPVVLAWNNGKGLVFRRTIAVDKDYLFTVTDSVENKTTAEVGVYPYALISRHGTPKTQGFYILHEGPIGVMGSAGLQELHYADLLKDGGTKTFKQTGGWLGITDKYWGSALVPSQKAPYEAEFSATKAVGSYKERFQTGYSLGQLAIKPGTQAGVENHLFAGAKQMTLIEAYGTKLGAKQFDLMIDWGWFYFITKPLFRLLHWLSLLLGNYGLAILATTVLVKTAFFPLANKSYESMAKMKKLQPEMEKIRERFKDDRVKQQQELMALYKNQKINPMSGCLPIVLQIPVFFALYKVLFVTIDMRHAPFFGWIHDLSAPDPTSIFNLFGLISYHVPEFLMVGAWPIIMGMTMWVQMQLNPQQPDPVQQKIFNWMPVMFTFLLASFPAGLVIYWAWNNVLSLLQQYFIMQKNGAEIHLWKNLGVHKLKQGGGAAGGSSPGGAGGTWDVAKLKERAAAAGRNLNIGKLKERIGGLASTLPETIDKLRKGLIRPAAPPAPEPPPRLAPSASDGGERDGSIRMSREQALQLLGLEPDATDFEIDAALEKEARQHKPGLNGSDHAIIAKINAARQALRGKERS